MVLKFLVAVFAGSRLVLGQTSCGRESIPYLIAVDLNGKPELGCDTPACFGPLRGPSDDYEQFDERNHRGRMHLSSSERTATCSGQFTDIACVQNDEWTGGVAEVNNGTHIMLTMECCQFSGLNYASEYKTMILRPGDRYVGGAVTENNRLVAFDLVKEVRKNVSELNEIHYVITVYRMSCASAEDPPLPKPVGPPEVAGSLPRPSVRPPRRHYGPRTDYDYSHERNDNRLRYGEYAGRGRYGGRRRFYRPTVDEYDYYETEPVHYSRRGHKRPRSRFDEQQLWPFGNPQKANSRIYGQKNYHNALSKQEYAEYAAEGKFLPQLYPEPTPSAQRDLYPQSIVSPAPSIPAYIQPSYGPPNTYAQPSPVLVQQPPVVVQSAVEYPGPSPCSDTCTTSYCSCNMNGYFSALQCFSAEMLVQTIDGIKRMDEIEIGDRVLSVDGTATSFSPVVMFLHRKPDELAEYIQLRTINGEMLKLTALHLLYATKCRRGEKLQLVKAEEITEGDCIYTVRGSGLRSSKVVSVDRVADVGIFAPLTANGDIVVNSVLASCHTNVAAQTLQQTFFSWFRFVDIWVQRIRRTFWTVGADGDLPFGLEYLTTIVDVFIPSSVLS